MSGSDLCNNYYVVSTQNMHLRLKSTFQVVLKCQISHKVLGNKWALAKHVCKVNCGFKYDFIVFFMNTKWIYWNGCAAEPVCGMGEV